MNARKKDDSLVEALFRLLEGRSWEEISLTDIARESGQDLAGLRGRIGDRFDILEEFAGRIDAEVIGAVDPDLKGEPARERLFDILMSRLDALAPYKAGIACLARSARRDPLLAARLLRLGATSQSWMLEAAGISSKGIGGAIRVQGLVLGFARVLGVWLRDDDPDMARTMAELDKVLKRGETVLQGLDRFRGAFERRRRPPPPDDTADTESGTA